MSATKLLLNLEGMKFMMAKLTPNQMWAIHIMASGSEIPDTITKTDLTNIITILCVKLKWIEGYEDYRDKNIVESGDKNCGLEYEYNSGFPERKDMQRPLHVSKNTDAVSGMLVSNSERNIEIEDHFPIEPTEGNKKCTSVHILEEGHHDTENVSTSLPKQDYSEYPFSCIKCDQKFLKRLSLLPTILSAILIKLTMKMKVCPMNTFLRLMKNLIL